MNREEADKIQIEAETMVSVSETGEHFVAENLTCWAYRRVETWPDLLSACIEAKARLEQCQKILNRYSDKYSAYTTANTQTYTKLLKVLAAIKKS